MFWSSVIKSDRVPNLVPLYEIQNFLILVIWVLSGETTLWVSNGLDRIHSVPVPPSLFPLPPFPLTLWVSNGLDTIHSDATFGWV